MEKQTWMEGICMIIKFCCKEMARSILSDALIQTCDGSDGLYLNGDEVIYCPFCGKEVSKISDEYIHEGY